jgi:prevent-host-death family protein
MTQATVHQAKTHLSKLIRKALDGEEVIIAKRDKPLVRVEAVHSKKSKRKLGSGKGLVPYIGLISMSRWKISPNTWRLPRTKRCDSRNAKARCVANESLPLGSSDGVVGLPDC